MSKYRCPFKIIITIKEDFRITERTITKTRDFEECSGRECPYYTNAIMGWCSKIYEDQKGV